MPPLDPNSVAHQQAPSYASPSPLSVRPMGPEELAWAAAQHLHHFPHGFFARLGERFLEEYYRSFLTSPHTCLLIALEDEQPVGYIAGVLDTTAHRTSLLAQHRGALAVRAARGMLRRPSLIVLFLQTRARTYGKRLMRRSASPTPRATAPSPESVPVGLQREHSPAVLSHLVVHPASRCRGIGRRLVTDFTSQAHAAGRAEVVLVTEADGLGQGFYHRLGWVQTDTRTTREGRGVLGFELQITQSVEKESSVSE